MTSLIMDPDGHIAGVDQTNGALIVIDAVHNNIHQGIMFQSDLVDLILADDASLDLLIRVIANTSAHMRFHAAIGGDGQAFMYEDPTTSADGTPVARNNRNRFSSNTSDTLIFSGPTVTGVGDLLPTGIIPGGGAGTPGIGGQIGSFEEWMLAPADYLFKLTNKSGGAQPASVALDWYEPE